MSKAAIFWASLIIATVFTVASVLSIYRINPDPQVGGDASQYIFLTHGDLDAVVSPFRFRVLVPLLAGLLPFSAGHSLSVITYVSLTSLFVVLVVSSYQLNRDFMASVLGVLLIVSSRWFLYNFQNPYLTDAFALAAIGVALGTLLTRRFPAFAISVVLGVLARETVLPFSLAWGVTRRWKQTVVILLLSVVAYLIPRLLIRSDVPATEYFWTAIQRDGLLASPMVFAREVTLSWGYLFLLAIPGLLFFPRRHMADLLMALVVLFVTTVGACLVAVDFGRMLEILGPVFALSSAQVLHTLRKASRRANVICAAFLLIVCVQFFTVVPNVLLPEELPSAFKWGREVAGLLLTTFAYVTIVRSSRVQFWWTEAAGKARLYAALSGRKPLR